MMGDRKHLTSIEVERLITTIKGNRNVKRDRPALALTEASLKQSSVC